MTTGAVTNIIFLIIFPGLDGFELFAITHFSLTVLIGGGARIDRIESNSILVLSSNIIGSNCSF